MCMHVQMLQGFGVGVGAVESLADLGMSCSGGGGGWELSSSVFFLSF